VTVAYDLLRELRCATVKEVAARLGVRYNTARAYLKRLVDRGLVEKRGSGRHVLYCIAKDEDVVPRGAYKLHTETRRRVARAVELLQQVGCVSVSGLMRALHIGHTEAYHLMRATLLTGRGVKLKIGNTAALCRDRAAAEEVFLRLRDAVHRLITENNMKYATPSKVARLAVRDGDAYALLSRFISLSNVDVFPPAVLRFVDGILRSLYGEPVKYHNKTVYIVSKPREDYAIDLETALDRALPAIDGETVIISFHVPHALVKAVDEYARQSGGTRSDVVRWAVAQLIEKYRNVEVDMQRPAALAAPAVSDDERVVVSFRETPYVAELLDMYVAVLQVSRSDVIRAAIRQMLDKIHNEIHQEEAERAVAT
jgi:metal-responsive CopG/Arc/MetJ family transcriptional regulator/DNA-binding transcriptional ArsR family regulator